MRRVTALFFALVLLTTIAVPHRPQISEAAICIAPMIVPTTTTDTVAANPFVSPNDAGGLISLRSAIQYANFHAGPDTICLNPLASGFVFTLTRGPADPDGTFGLDDGTGDLDVFGGNLTIFGFTGTVIQAGTTKSTSSVTGNGIDRVFHVDGVNLTLDFLEIRNGKAGVAVAPGGGIFVNGTASPATLTMHGVMLYDNFSATNGGGISLLNATATIDDVTSVFPLPSRVSTNVAPFGGGIAMQSQNAVLPAPVLNLTKVTINGNSASGAGSVGGGIWQTAGTVTADSSTINGNSAVGSGGGIFSRGPVTLTNSTVSGNTLSAPVLGGGGVYSGGASAAVNTFNTTIADNVSPGTGGQVAFGAVGSIWTARNTLIAQGGGGSVGNCFSVPAITSQGGNVSSDATCPLPGAGDKMNANPALQALANNGGPAWTHLLGAGSAAVDAGTNTNCPAVDQRGLPRPTDGDGNGSVICDSGSVEMAVSVNPPAIAKAFNPTSINSGGTSTLTLSFTNPNGQALTNVSVGDTLPAGMTVAPTPGVTQTCGATMTATAGSNSIAITGGSLAANGSCSVSVNVTATGATGGLTNTTGPVSAQGTGNGLTANAVLTILPAGQLPTANTPTPIPPPPPPPVVVIPQVRQNPGAVLAVMGGIGNGTRNNTPVPSQGVAPSSMSTAPSVMPVLRPPSTGDAGLARASSTLPKSDEGAQP